MRRSTVARLAAVAVGGVLALVAPVPAGAGPAPSAPRTEDTTAPTGPPAFAEPLSAPASEPPPPSLQPQPPQPPPPPGEPSATAAPPPGSAVAPPPGSAVAPPPGSAPTPAPGGGGAGADTRGGLAATGTAIGGILVLGTGMLAAGIAMLAVRRRRDLPGLLIDN